jgi:hypothetical protein
MKLESNHQAGNRVSSSGVPKRSLGTRKNRRPAFTLVEMLVATALVMFIMLILSEAFVAGLEAFRTLKGIGDMEERLRAAALIIRNDLQQDHFESGVRLSDPNFWQQGNPRQGFFNVTQGFALTSAGNGVTGGAGPQPVTLMMPPGILVPATLVSNTWVIQPNTVLLVDTGSLAEFVLVLSTNPATNSFTAAFQNSHAAGFNIRVVRQYEGNDSDGLPLSRATDHVLHLAVKQPGNRPENFFTAHLPYVLASGIVNPFFATGSTSAPLPNALPNPNYAPTTFGDQATDARFQDSLPPANPALPVGYKAQWAEVAYFLWPNGSTAGGTPLYALYRAEFKVVPDNRYLNGKVFNPQPPPQPPILLVNGWNPPSSTAPGDGFQEMCARGGTSTISGTTYNTYYFPSPSSLAVLRTTALGDMQPDRTFTYFYRAEGRGLFNSSIPEIWAATLVATDVVSFDVQIAPGGPPLSTGGLLATSELPWATQNPTFIPPLVPGLGIPTVPTGTNDFVDIPSGTFDTALSSNQYSINAVRIILRVWNMKTNQTRQVSIVQQL